ncbi:MAG: hypothetical protein ACRECV_21210, partial [Xanthobacteraceae bacterium]
MSNTEPMQVPMEARHRYTQENGEAWLKRLEPELAKLPKLTVVVINCRTGEYVTGATLREAADRFESRFATDLGFAHQIGGGFFVGG